MSQYIFSTHGLTKTTTITITQWWQHFGAGSGGKSSVAGDENENSVMNSFRIEVIWLPLWCSSVHWQKKNTRRYWTVARAALFTRVGCEFISWAIYIYILSPMFTYFIPLFGCMFGATNKYESTGVGDMKMPRCKKYI